MLRITVVNQGERETLKLEGSVAGPWVQELALVAEDSLGRSRPLGMDLSSVGFVDAEGTRLLQALIGRGAVIQDCSRFVAELLRRGC